MRTYLCFLVAGVTVLPAGCSSPTTSSVSGGHERKKEGIQDTWKPVSVVENGKPTPADTLKDLRFVITKDTIERKNSSGVLRKLTYTRDDGKEPKWIDAKDPDGQKGPMLGIYELKGNSLAICIGAPGKERPTRFESEPGSGMALLTLERE